MATLSDLQPHGAEPSPVPEGSTPWWRGRALRLALTTSVIGFGVVLIVLRWDTYGDTLTRAAPAWLALGVALLVVGNLLATLLHREILAGRGIELAPREMGQLVLVPNVMKYVPGFVAQAATFYQLGRRAGIDRRGVVLLFVEAMWVTLAVTSALGGGALLMVDSTVPTWMAACIVVASITVLVPAVRSRLLRLVRVLPNDAPELGRSTLRQLLIAAMGVATLGLHGVALARAVGATDLTFTESVAAFAGGWVVGLLVIVFPGGIGPREVVASLLLADFTSPTAAVVLVVISRFATIVADVIAGTIALLLPSAGPSTSTEPARLPRSAATEVAGG